MRLPLMQEAAKDRLFRLIAKQERESLTAAELGELEELEREWLGLNYPGPNTCPGCCD